MAGIPLLVPKADYVDVTPPSNSYYTCDTQILRSVSLWSNGIETEASIQVRRLQPAKHGYCLLTLPAWLR